MTNVGHRFSCIYFCFLFAKQQLAAAATATQATVAAVTVMPISCATPRRDCCCVIQLQLHANNPHLAQNNRALDDAAAAADEQL